MFLERVTAAGAIANFCVSIRLAADIYLGKQWFN